MNYHRIYGLTDYAQKEYASLSVPLEKRDNNWVKENGLDVSHCIECGECEGKCPQHLKIVKQLKETQAELTLKGGLA